MKFLKKRPCPRRPPIRIRNLLCFALKALGHFSAEVEERAKALSVVIVETRKKFAHSPAGHRSLFHALGLGRACRQGLRLRGGPVGNWLSSDRLRRDRLRGESHSL